MICSNVPYRPLGSFTNAEATVEVLQFGNNKTGKRLSIWVELVHVGFDSKKLTNQNITEGDERNGPTVKHLCVCVVVGRGEDQVYSQM